MNTMNTVTRAVLERRSFWQDHLTRWQSSGLTQVAYCRQQGLKVAQFGYWKKRLRPAPSPGTTYGAADFIAVQMAGASATLAVVLNGGNRPSQQSRPLGLSEEGIHGPTSGDDSGSD